MRESNNRQLVVTLALKSRPRNKRYKPKPLKSLSLKMIEIYLESVNHQLRNCLFLSLSQIKGLEKRKRDLSSELSSRLEYDEYMCSTYPKEIDGIPCREYWENGHMVANELEEFRKGEENPNRKSLCRNIKVKGVRIKPGKKVEFSNRRRKSIIV